MPPDWVPKTHRDLWEKPWTVSASHENHPDFKRELLKHGYLSPNFRVSEFDSHADPCGCDAARTPHADKTQALAFKLEHVRHAIGDHAIGVLSGYRSPCHNQCVGGASESQHMEGTAIDPIKPGAVSWDEFDRAMEHEFAHGGIGTGAVTGHVMHVDIGPERRWTYAGS